MASGSASPAWSSGQGKRWWLRWWWLLIGVVLLMLAIAAGLAVVFQEYLVFMPYVPGHPVREGPPQDYIETVWRVTAEGDRVEAWFIPGEGRSAVNPGPLVIRFHGNGEIIDETYAHWPYRKAGISQLLPEYRGYGQSGGRPSQEAVVDDAVWFYDWVVKRPEVAKGQVVAHGRSLGTGVAAILAERRPVQGLILESAFTSVVEVANRFWAPKFVVRHPFRNDEVLPTLGIPVLLFHGRADSIVPVDHAERLHEMIPDSKLVILRDFGHDDIEIGYGMMWPRIKRFLEALGWEVRELPSRLRGRMMTSQSRPAVSEEEEAEAGEEAGVGG